jgi:hypothetical protein
MKKLAIMLVVFFPLQGFSFTNYIVDWPRSNSKYHTLEITIETCTTAFKIPTDELSNFRNNSDALDQAVELAIKRYRNSCRNT